MFLYACKSWILTTEPEKKTKAVKMRGYRRLLNISCNDRVTNEDVRRKMQAAIEKYMYDPDLGQDKETEGVRPHLEVFWLGKDDSTSER